MKCSAYHKGSIEATAFNFYRCVVGGCFEIEFDYRVFCNCKFDKSAHIYLCLSLGASKKPYGKGDEKEKYRWYSLHTLVLIFKLLVLFIYLYIYIYIVNADFTGDKISIFFCTATDVRAIFWIV